MPHPTVIASFRSHAEAVAAERALIAEGIGAGSGPRSEGYERLCPDVFPEGFDVIVDGADAGRAIAIVQRLWPDELRAEAFAIERCPACGSTDIARLPRLKLFIAAAVVMFVASLIFGEGDLFLLVTAILTGILILTPNRRSRTCGERWRGRRDVVPEDAIESADHPCPRCGSPDSEPLDHRKQNAATLLVNLLMPPLVLLWPFRRRHRCSRCGHEWR